MNTRALIVAALIAASTAAEAANIRKNFRVEEKFTLREGGALVLENPLGDIEILGVDAPGVDTVAVKTVIGVDDAAVEEGRQMTALIVGGDDTTRILRTAMPPVPGKGWSSKVNWRVKVPRSTHVRVVANSGDRIRVANIRGNVIVKNVNGEVVIENVRSTVNVESVNGDLIYSSAQPGNATLSTVNGDISIRVKPTAVFQFVAEAIRGDIVTNLRARGGLMNASYRGTVNGPGGPVLRVGTLMGNIELVSLGAAGGAAESLKKNAARLKTPPILTANASKSAPVTPEVRLDLVEKTYAYATNLGNVRIGEIRGDGDIFTGAGEVQVGAVRGSLKVRSHGGPLHLGDIEGTLIATTRAGDISVEAARRGGEIATQGGTVRVLYTSGPTRLISGGGDITVRQAAAQTTAQTSSGDVFITVDPNATSYPLTAKTENGNVVINVSTKFGADVDATVLTSDPGAHMIVSDVQGLSISREQVGNKTRIRATGKINGGGEPMVLEAAEGGIRITTGRPVVR